MKKEKYLVHKNSISNTNLPKLISLNKYKELVKLNEKLKYNPYLEYDYITNKFLDKRYHTISVRR